MMSKLLTLFLYLYIWTAESQENPEKCLPSITKTEINFLVAINCTFVDALSLEGFAIDVLFDSPVDSMEIVQAPANETYLTEVHKDHWILYSPKGHNADSSLYFNLLAKGLTQNLEITSLQFNGILMFGTAGKISRTNMDNGISSSAMQDCSLLVTNFYSENEKIYFGLSLPTDSNEVGLTIDLLFNGLVKTINVDHLKSVKKSENHWVLKNEGWRAEQGESHAEINMSMDAGFLSSAPTLQSVVVNRKIVCGWVTTFDKQQKYHTFETTIQSNHDLLAAVLFFVLLLSIVGFVTLAPIAKYLYSSYCISPRAEEELQFSYDQNNAADFPIQSYPCNQNDPPNMALQEQPYLAAGQCVSTRQENTRQQYDQSNPETDDWGVYENPKR